MSSSARKALLVLAGLLLIPLAAHAWNRGAVDQFAALPPGEANPEGIGVDRHGDVYVSTFAVTKASGPGKIFVFSPQGHFKRELAVAGSSQLLLGLAFHPATDELLVVDFGAGNVLRVDPHSGASSVFAAIPGGGLNALAFDSAGNVYVSDSFQGIVWRTVVSGGAAIEWANDPLLRTEGFPPFGVNGMAFNRDGSALFVANTGNDQVIRIPASGGAAGAPEVFVNSVNGADGLIIDEDDNLWICANQSDEIVVVDPSGRAIAKLGDFGGLRRGAPVGLLFPASLAQHGGWIYVTNLALDLRLFGLPQSIDSQWAAEVTTHTIARLRARIPR
jgi:DNA-binding beta-propeller fold protein YncE